MAKTLKCCLTRTSTNKRKMAKGYKRYSNRNGASAGGNMTRALGRMVGLLLSLYVFDEVISAIMPSVNSSAYFATTVTFVTNLFPVIGILGAFEIIYDALRRAKLV